MHTRLLLLIPLLFAALTLSLADDRPQDRATLRGIRDIRVRVERLQPDIEGHGLTRDELQTDVELRLRRNRVRVAEGASAYLYVNLNTLRDSQLPLVFFSTMVSLNQPVTLARDPSVKAIATTWYLASVGSVGASKTQTLREAVAEEVDKFVNAYLAANQGIGDDEDWEASIRQGQESQKQGRNAEAEKHYMAAVAQTLEFGDADPRRAKSLSYLGLLYYIQKRYAEAEPLLRRAAAVAEAGPMSAEEQATTLDNLGSTYRAQEKYAEAEPVLEKALAIRQKVLSKNDPLLLARGQILANIYMIKEKYREAEALLQNAATAREKALGADDPEVASAVHDLALLYDLEARVSTNLTANEKLARQTEAERLYRRAIAIWEKTLGRESASVAIALKNYAGLLRITGRIEEATALEVREKAIRAKNPSDNRPK